MSSSLPAPNARRQRIVWLIVFVVAFDLAFFWQRAGGAARSEFGGHPDEAGHVVTGLFVRDSLVLASDWLLQGAHGSPIKAGKDFADDYYAHYPKIGLGVWPPFFYLAQAAWTLPFGASRTSLLLLMCALAGGLGLLVFRTLREEYGALLAAVGAALLLSLPLVRNYYGMVMAETLSALLMSGAMLAFGSFLDRGHRRSVLWFGLLAALAILTKGTGLALALAAPLALLWTRRFHLLKRPALWLALLIILIVAGPWTWATRDLGKGGWLQPEPSWSFTGVALPYYAGKFGFALGWLPLFLFGLGFVAKVRGPSLYQGRWAAAGALISAVIIFQSIAPVGLEARHLIPALPAACLFVIAGLHSVLAWFSRRDQRLAGSNTLPPARLKNWDFWAGAALILGMMWSILPVAPKGYAGFAPLADELLGEAAPAEITIISSDATGEGIFISEVALHERRPKHVIRRASKDLASSTWSGSGYQPAFQNDDELLVFLTAGKILYRYLVLDDAVPPDKRRAHQDQLRRLIEEHPEHFQLLASAEITRGGSPQAVPARLYKILRKN